MQGATAASETESSLARLGSNPEHFRIAVGNAEGFACSSGFHMEAWLIQIPCS